MAGGRGTSQVACGTGGRRNCCGLRAAESGGAEAVYGVGGGWPGAPRPIAQPAGGWVSYCSWVGAYSARPCGPSRLAGCGGRGMLEGLSAPAAARRCLRRRLPPVWGPRVTELGRMKGRGVVRQAGTAGWRGQVLLCLPGCWRLWGEALWRGGQWRGSWWRGGGQLGGGRGGRLGLLVAPGGWERHWRRECGQWG